MAGSDGAAVGIDVGMTTSCVGVWRSNWVEIIENDVGKKKTPSCIAFTDTRRLIGEAAMNHLIMNPSNAIFDIKRLIGKRFTDYYVQSNMNKWPFKVMEDRDAHRPMIVVHRKGEMKQFAPQEILSMLLTKMCETAEAHIGYPVKNAVISVPASFSFSQRQAIKDAAAITGLNVLQIISDSTAAAIAYAFNKNVGNGERKNVLVFDLGGGSLDVSLIAIEKGTFEVISTVGDAHLGGEDFSNRIVDYLVQEFKSKHGKDISSNHKALARLRASCEKAKHELSFFSTPATIDIDCLCDDIHFTSTISRDMFVVLNMDLFQRCKQIVEDCLSEANIAKDSIHEILLIGGSTRVPFVQELLRPFFPGKQLCKEVNADEAVAIGATLLAASFNKKANTMEVPKLNIADVTPRSLFLTSNYGHELKIISKNTIVPIQQIVTVVIPFKPSCDYQQMISFHVIEQRSRDYNLVLEFTVPFNSLAFHDLIEICFDINIDGILNISVNGKNGKMTFTAGQLREEERLKMVHNCNKYKLDDEEYIKSINAKNSSERYAYKARNEMWNRQRNSIPVAVDLKEANGALEQVIQWLRNAEHVEANEIENKMKKLQGLCEPIIDQMHQRTTSRGMRGAHPHPHESANAKPKCEIDNPSLAPDCSSHGSETHPCLVDKNPWLVLKQCIPWSSTVQPGQTKTSTKSGKNANQGSILGDLSESKTGLDNPINKPEGTVDGIAYDQAKVNHEKEKQRASLDEHQLFDQKPPGLIKTKHSRSARVDTQDSKLETSSKVHHTKGRPRRHMEATENAPTTKEEGRSICEAAQSRKGTFPLNQGDSTETIMTSAATQSSNQSVSDSIKEDWCKEEDNMVVELDDPAPSLLMREAPHWTGGQPAQGRESLTIEQLRSFSIGPSRE